MFRDPALNIVSVLSVPNKKKWYTASATSNGVAFGASGGRALGRAGPSLVGSSRDAGSKGEEKRSLLSHAKSSGGGEILGVVKGEKRDASYGEQLPSDPIEDSSEIGDSSIIA